MKIIIGLLMFSVLFLSCKKEEMKVAYINSYHKGYPPSDEITSAIISKIDSAGYNLCVFYIDSKRTALHDLLSATIDSIRRELEEYEPDLIIASDDFAVKYLIKPFYSELTAPYIVFCGINWSAEEYSLKSPEITGILEVLPLHESLNFLRKYYPDSKKLAVLSENSLSEKNNTLLLDTLYSNMGFVTMYLLASDFDEWKEMFIKANSEADIIYLPTNGSVSKWKNEEAKEFVINNIKKPVFTCDDFMMPYCVLGFTKVASEQGEWAAETAIKILNGTKPSDIPVSQNKKSKLWFNHNLATIIGFMPDQEWISNAELVK